MLDFLAALRGGNPAGALTIGAERPRSSGTVKLPPIKPFVKRQKNDMADAEATTEAAQRPTMSFP